MDNLEREYMINNFELNKDKLSKLTRKVILIGGIISTLLTGGCKTKENSSNNTSVTEVTPTPTETPNAVEEDYSAYKVKFTASGYTNTASYDEIEEVSYQGEKVPEDGYIYLELPWQEHTDKYNPMDFDPEHAEYPWVRAVYKYRLPKYYDYDKFLYAIDNIMKDRSAWMYIFETSDPFVIDEEYVFSLEKTPDHDDCYSVYGMVNLIQKVDVKAK